MALQPAAGARDLNPQQVERNHFLTSRLADVYRRWGYEEVSPPRVERLDTLTAGGAIDNRDIVKLVADEPLGLRPEMTASIARAACNRLSNKPRPLRLWACGTVFESRTAAEGGLHIEENLQSGVELFGVSGISAELELFTLLMESLSSLGLDTSLKPKLLIGHTDIMKLILKPYEGKIKEAIKRCLIEYDRIGLEEIEKAREQKSLLIKVLETRGASKVIISTLKSLYGDSDVISNLNRLFTLLEPIAEKKGVEVQLDPTFQPHFELYTGIVFQLVCQGTSGPVVIARGGRYDQLVKHCGAKEDESAGVGFSFAIESIREQVNTAKIEYIEPDKKTLITYGPKKTLESALLFQSKLHQEGITAQLELECCKDMNEAKKRQEIRNCSELEWLNE